jgi:hypothetical protein
MASEDVFLTVIITGSIVGPWLFRRRERFVREFRDRVGLPPKD